MSNLLKAQEAYEKSMVAMDLIDISLELEKTLELIDVNATGGYVATYTNPMDFLKAEKLAIELETLGYCCSTNVANMVNNGQRQAYVIISWKHIPPNTRERLK